MNRRKFFSMFAAVAGAVPFVRKWTSGPFTFHKLKDVGRDMIFHERNYVGTWDYAQPGTEATAYTEHLMVGSRKFFREHNGQWVSDDSPWRLIDKTKS